VEREGYFLQLHGIRGYIVEVECLFKELMVVSSQSHAVRKATARRVAMAALGTSLLCRIRVLGNDVL